MKRATILVALMALMVALVAGTAAAKQNGKGKATYNFKGTLTEVAEDGSYVKVYVTDGNKRTRQHLGIQQFSVTPDTKIEVNEEEVDLSALEVGEHVRVQSKAAKDAPEGFDARKISIRLEEETEEPTP